MGRLLCDPHEKAARNDDYCPVCMLDIDKDMLQRVLQAAVDAMEHAIHLGYVGEGSTLGSYKDVISRAKLVGIKPTHEND